MDITSANAVFMLQIPGLYPTPQALQQFMADDIFDTEDIEPTENVMGVDGYMSSGFVPFMTPQTISLMPDSPSYVIFEDWLSAMKTARQPYFCNATISLPSIGREYTLTNGVLSRIKQIPGAKKVLQGTAFRITWEDVSPANV